MKNISVIKAKINRLDIKGVLTKLFDELEVYKRNEINDAIKYLNDEQPIFACYLSREYWWVITNIRLIVFKSDVINEYIYEEIIDIKVRDIFEKGKSNTECNALQLLLQNKKEIDFDLEDNTWYSVLNLLKFLVSEASVKH